MVRVCEVVQVDEPDISKADTKGEEHRAFREEIHRKDYGKDIQERKDLEDPVG